MPEEEKKQKEEPREELIFVKPEITSFRKPIRPSHPFPPAEVKRKDEFVS